MTEITAKILDSTHLELSQPICCRQGNIISIFIRLILKLEAKLYLIHFSISPFSKYVPLY